MLQKGGGRYGVEVKYQDAPSLSSSMRTALEDLRLERLTVLYSGKLRYDLGERVTVAPLSELATGDPGIVTAGRGGGRNRRNAR